jgi:hypothetical protein
MRVHKCTRKHFLYLMLCLRGDGVYIWKLVHKVLLTPTSIVTKHLLPVFIRREVLLLPLIILLLIAGAAVSLWTISIILMGSTAMALTLGWSWLLLLSLITTWWRRMIGWSLILVLRLIALVGRSRLLENVEGDLRLYFLY